MSTEIRKLTDDMAFVNAKVITMKLDIGSKLPYPELEAPTIIRARELFNQWNSDEGRLNQHKSWDHAYIGWNTNTTENYYHYTNHTPFSSRYA